MLPSRKFWEPRASSRRTLSDGGREGDPQNESRRLQSQMDGTRRAIRQPPPCGPYRRRKGTRRATPRQSRARAPESPGNGGAHAANAIALERRKLGVKVV